MWFSVECSASKLPTAGLGVAIWFRVRRVHRELRIRHGFLIVVCAWLAWVLVGALPFVLLSTPELSYVDAVFESMSGLTTTGSTVLTDLDEWSEAILLWRALLQWVGGIGILAVSRRNRHNPGHTRQGCGNAR